MDFQCLAQPASEQLPPEAVGEKKNTEAHNQTKCREYETLEHSTLNRMPPSNLLLMDSEDPVEEEMERVSEPKGMEDTKETKPSKYSRTRAYMTSQKLQQHEQGLQKCALNWVLEL